MNLLLRRALIPIYAVLFGIFVTTTDALAACTSTQYLGYNGSTCQTCPSSSDFYKPMVASCGNGTLTCKAWAYKVRRTSSSNELVCFPCPGISSTDLNVQQYTGALNGDQYMNAATTWQTSSRCTLIQSRPDDGSGCEMNVKYVPSSACITAKQYSTASVPVGNGVDVDAEAVSTTQCTYTRTVQYKNAIAGHRLSSTGYGNSCVACGTNQYSYGGNITSCSECPYYTGTGPNCPWGNWGECQAIIEGLDSSGNLGSQGTGAGSMCSAGSAATTNTKGTYVSGMCSLSGEPAFIITISSGSYCQNTVLGSISGKICSNVFHCNSYECEGCNNQNGWITGFGCQLYNGNPTSSSATVLCPSLYSAQRFVSAVMTQESTGCVTQCHIY